MDRYFQFLMRIVDRDGSHELLLSHLHRIEFYSLVPNDDNRAEDGKRLREIFVEEEGAHMGSHFFSKHCSVLEMLIGLAFRMEYQLEGTHNALSACDCFWIFMKNLDLDWCDNFEYHQDAGDEAIEQAIDILLERKYNFRGDGSLFPMRQRNVRGMKNRKKVEIWYQMGAYLLENFEF